MTAAKDPAAPPHLGELIMNLREAAHMTRAELERQTGVQASALKAIEYARHRASASILRRLLRAACMADLPNQAAAAGLPMNVGAEVDPPSGSGPDWVEGAKP